MAQETKLFGILSAFAAFTAVMAFGSPSEAFVNQIVIDQTATVNVTPVIPGTSTPGPAMSYTVYQGRIFGLLAPTNPLNAIITDIALASWSGFPSAGPRSGPVRGEFPDCHTDQPRAAQRPHDPRGA